MKRLLKTIAVLLIFSNVNAQNHSQEERINKNLIYGGIGVGGIYFPAFIYYERYLQEHFLNSKFSSFVTVGTGAAAHWDGASYYTAAKFGLLLGERKAHLETALGVNYFYQGDFQGSLPFSASLGYRANKPDQKYVFRTGVSWPEAVYVSWGFRF